VTEVDWLILAFTVLLAMYGYIQGFIMGVLSLAGFAIGAFLGTRLGPLILPGGSHSQYAPLFGLVGALLAGAVLASGFEGIGARARVLLRLPGLRLVDGVLGAALTAAVALGIAWIVGAIAVQSTGSPVLRGDIQRSAILRGLDEVLPPAGPILHALDRIDPLPSVHGPSANVPAPPPAIVAEHKVVAAGPSVVKVLGTACGLGIEGSGWVAAPNVVVTNAHVVAGESDTSVEIDGNPPELRAEVIDFDPHDDISVLRVDGLHERVLPLASHPKGGTPAAILGYPLDGGFDLEPGRIGQTETVSTEDAYGNGPVLRSITALRGRVRPGNSGGPMVDTAGEVVATVFAAITGGTTGEGGFAVPNSLVRTQLNVALSRNSAVGTGACASG
jgi:S1-C subfamily serine protease